MHSKPPAKIQAAASPPTPVARKLGRPSYQANDNARTMVRLLSAGGIMQDRIARAIGISAPTLRKHYRQEIMIGQTEIDALAIATLINAMRGGGMNAVIAAKYWTQCRMGWSERTTVVDDAKSTDTLRIIIELVG